MVTAIAGARIFGSGMATQGETQPYVVWSIVSGVPGNTLACKPDHDSQRVQIDCYAKGETVARNLGTAVRNAIEDHYSIEFGPWNDYEPDTGLYRWSMDVAIILDR